MHELSMKKRNIISNRKKIFCDKLKEEALKEAKERAERKKNSKKVKFSKKYYLFLLFLSI